MLDAWHALELCRSVVQHARKLAQQLLRKCTATTAHLPYGKRAHTADKYDLYDWKHASKHQVADTGHCRFAFSWCQDWQLNSSDSDRSEGSGRVQSGGIP